MCGVQENLSDRSDAPGKEAAGKGCVTLSPSGDCTRMVKLLKEVPKPTGINKVRFFFFLFSHKHFFYISLLGGCRCV